MKKVIFDCDNTMGIKGCDVDDGLALLYLLGKNNIKITGITTAYGNSDIESVYSNTAKMLEEIGRKDIRVYQGCTGPKDLESEAAEFMLKCVTANPGHISILATGSLTNLYAAYCKDNSFFEKVAEIVLMGGVTHPLIINGKKMSELNFSCDPQAADCVLRKGRKVTIITGNNCLRAYFDREEFLSRFQEKENKVADYILNKCLYWFEDLMKEKYGLNGFYNWDVVAAAYLAEPGLFADCLCKIQLDLNSLKQGLLNIKPDHSSDFDIILNLPKINQTQQFKEEIYKTWLKSEIML